MLFRVDRSLLAALVLTGVARGAPAQAQAAAPVAARPSASATAARPRPAPVLRLVAGGVVGGALGTGVGLLVSIATVGGCQGRNCGWATAVAAIAGGEALGVAAGVQTAGHGRPTLGRLALASGAVVAATVATIALTQPGDVAGGALVLAMPVAQLAATVAVARRSAR